jgi:hypothetical protein
VRGTSERGAGIAVRWGDERKKIVAEQLGR